MTYRIHFTKLDWVHKVDCVGEPISVELEADCIEEAELKFMTRYPFYYNDCFILNLSNPTEYVITPSIFYIDYNQYWIAWWKLLNERSFELFMKAQDKMIERNKNR